MFLNCASFAFQHTLLWSGPVSPSITLRVGEEKRPVGPIVADVFTVLSSLVLTFALDFVRRDIGMAAATVAATLGLALFAGSGSSGMLDAGQVFYGMGSTAVRLIIDVLIVETVRDKYDLPRAFAVMALPRAIAQLSVSTVRYHLHEPELRHALTAFACIEPVIGLLFVGILYGFRERLQAHRPFRVAMSEFWERRSRQPEFLVGRTLLLLAVVAVFTFLWLVQMDILPWSAAIPPLVVFLAMVAPFSDLVQERVRDQWDRLWLLSIPNLNRKCVRLRHRWLRRGEFRRLGPAILYGLLRRAKGLCRELFRVLASRVSARRSGLLRWRPNTWLDSPSWVSELSFRDLFTRHPLTSKPEFAVCATCLLWRSTCSWMLSQLTTNGSYVLERKPPPIPAGGVCDVEFQRTLSYLGPVCRRDLVHVTHRLLRAP